MNVKPIVLVAVSRKNLDKITREYKDLRSIFQRLEDRGEIKLICEPFTSIEDIKLVFEKFAGQVKIFHFAGHSDGERLYLDDHEFPIINLKPFVTFLGQQSTLEFVFFNCCNSFKIKEALLSVGIPRCILTKKEVDDTSAWIFSSAFYHSVSSGKSFHQAFLSASNELDMLSTTQTHEAERGFELATPSTYKPSDGWFFHPPSGDRTSLRDLTKKPFPFRISKKSAVWINRKSLIGAIGIIASILSIYSFFYPANIRVEESNPKKGHAIRDSSFHRELRGVVVDTKRRGIPWVQVRFNEHIEYTDRDGIFIFEQVELPQNGDSLLLSFYKEGFNPLSNKFPIHTYGNIFRINGDILLSAPSPVPLPYTLQLTGQIFDRKNKEAVAQALVIFQGQEIYSRSSGFFSLSGNSKNDWGVLTVIKDGYEVYKRNIPIGTTDIQIPLIRIENE